MYIESAPCPYSFGASCIPQNPLIKRQLFFLFPRFVDTLSNCFDRFKDKLQYW